MSAQFQDMLCSPNSPNPQINYMFDLNQSGVNLIPTVSESTNTFWDLSMVERKSGREEGDGVSYLSRCFIGGLFPGGE